MFCDKVAIRGYSWLFLESGQKKISPWQFAAIIRGYSWLFMAIRGYFVIFLRVAISVGVAIFLARLFYR